MMGWQWHQLDHIQIICTLLQTDNRASTSPLTYVVTYDSDYIGVPNLIKLDKDEQLILAYREPG